MYDALYVKVVVWRDEFINVFEVPKIYIFGSIPPLS